jgi:hypothetical protein
VRATRRCPAGAIPIVALAVLLFSSTQQPANAQSSEPIPVPDLLENGSTYNGRVVTVEGELVGDYGFRQDGFMWTQLNDDSYARAAVVDGGPLTGANVGIGIRMRSDLARDLDPVGGYRLEGPVIKATGIWRFHDPARGGESYLAVESFEVIKAGRRLEEGPDWVAFGAGLLLLAIAGVLKVRQTNDD